MVAAPRGTEGGGVTTHETAAIVWDPRFLFYDFGPGHPFSEKSRGLAAELLERSLAGTGRATHWIRTVTPARRADLERFHDPAYLDFVDDAGAREDSILLDGGDTPSFPGCYEEAARLAAGAEMGLAWTLEHRRPAFHPAGGLHHAHPDRASGFCVLNDVALAVRSALDQRLRVAYLDIDAHHGDGVMYGFYDSGQVLDIDFHQDGRTLFPGTGFPHESGKGDGSGLKVNVPLPPLAGDEALLPLFRRVVPPLLRSFAPDVIVLQHGVDGHVADPLAQLQYTPRGYAEIDASVIALASELCRGRLLVTGGGGYRPDAVTRVLAMTGLRLAGAPAPVGGEAVPEEWRERFRAEIGAPAPRAWVDAERPARSRWSRELEESLVGELERATGVRLPPASD
jgi:acetoin utilization protein AcuC